MNSKIKIEIYGWRDQQLSSGCGCSGKDCCRKSSSFSGCLRCGNGSHRCSSNSQTKISKTVGEGYNELEEFIKDSDISNNAELEFIDVYHNNKEDNNYFRVKEIINKGFEPPITIIDNIIRYYGGISNDLIYKDVIELLEITNPL